jgi:hypothetical protein
MVPASLPDGRPFLYRFPYEQAHERAGRVDMPVEDVPAENSARRRHERGGLFR